MNAFVWSVVTSFLLVVARIGGFVAASPFPGNYVPQNQRVGLVFMLTLVVASYIAPQAPVTEFGMRTLGAGALEVVVGLLMGLAFRMVLVAADVLGAVVSQAVGLSMPSVLNPALETNESALARVMSLLAIALSLKLGVHRIVIGYVLESFRVLPLADASSLPSVTKLFVDWTGEALSVGVRLGMPVVAVTLVLQLVLGLVSRVAPSLQIFSVGLSVIVASGLVALLASFDSIQDGLGAHFASASSYVEQVISTLARRR